MPVLPAAGNVEGSGQPAGERGRFLQEKPLAGNREVLLMCAGLIRGL